MSLYFKYLLGALLQGISLIMFKQFFFLAVMCMFALCSRLSSAGSLNHHTKRFQSSDGYWESYSLSSGCFKCKCSLTTGTVYNDRDTASHMILVEINESTCDGVPISPVHNCTNSCIGRHGFLIGQMINYGKQFNGTMGESTCYGVYNRDSDLLENYNFVINCHGQQRSESIMFTL